MAIKWIDGFEAYTTVDVIGKRYAVATMGTSAFRAGREAGSALGFIGTELSTPDLGDAATYVAGFAFMNVNMVAVAPVVVFEVRDGTTVQIDVRFDPATGKFQVNRGSTVLGTGTRVLTAGAWYYVELKVLVDASVGTVQLRVNETLDVDLSGGDQNTQQSANAVANRFAFRRGGITSGEYRIDDLYILDSSGAANNDLLGDMKVEVLRPLIDGTYHEWDTTTTSNAAAVAKLGDADFISSATAGVRDTYHFGNLQKVTGAVKAVSVVAWARNSDSTNHVIKSLIRSAGTDGLAAAGQTVDDTANKPYAFVTETDPATGSAWTVTGVNGAEFGIKLIS